MSETPPTTKNTEPSGGVRPRIHAWAIGLTVTLMAAFLLATALYARNGHVFILQVFETQQIARAEMRDGRKAVLVYEDYLRVNPASVRVRDRLVNELLELGAIDEALDTARGGAETASPIEEPLARLVVGRVQLAAGHLDEAERIFQDVLRASLPRSGEASYGLAHIYAARGQFEAMRAAYAEVQTNGPVNSTESFKIAWDNAEVALDTESRSAARAGLALEQLGRIEEALDVFERIEPAESGPPAVWFWKGVAGEVAGNPVVAARFYRQAAEAGYPLAKVASNRLRDSDPIL